MWCVCICIVEALEAGEGSEVVENEVVASELVCRAS